MWRGPGGVKKKKQGKSRSFQHSGSQHQKAGADEAGESHSVGWR